GDRAGSARRRRPSSSPGRARSPAPGSFDGLRIPGLQRLGLRGGLRPGGRAPLPRPLGLVGVGVGLRQDELPCGDQALEGLLGGARLARRFGEAHERGPESHPSVVDDLDEAEGREPPERLGDLAADGLLGDALVVAPSLRVQGPHQRFGAHDARELREHLVPGEHPAVLHRGRIEVEERERLPDEHLARREVPSPEAIAGGQEVEVAVRAVNQLAAEPPVEGLEPGLRVDEERVPVAVVAIDVARAAASPASPPGRSTCGPHEGRTHSSMTRPSSIGTQGRSARASGRDTRAIVWAIRPVATKRSPAGRPPATRAVTSARPRAPPLKAARTAASSKAWVSTAGSSARAGSASGRRRFTGGRSPCGATTSRRRRIAGASATVSAKRPPLLAARHSRTRCVMTLDGSRRTTSRRKRWTYW